MLNWRRAPAVAALGLWPGRHFLKRSGRKRQMVLQAGSQAQDFSLPALDNKQYSLIGALRDGPVLAAFFKVSCPVCQFTLPFLERFYRHFRDSKARIWAISQDTSEASREFAAEYGLTMPVLLEDMRTYDTSNAYGLTHVPSIFLIAQN